LGRATALTLAAAGAELVVADLDAAGGQEVADRVGGHFRTCDVSDLDANRALVDFAVERCGGVDIAVLNAGVSTGCGVGDDFDLARYRRAMGANLDGVVFGAHAALPAIRARGGGAIIATASLAGLTAVPLDPLYAANKHAVVGLTRSLGPALASEGVRFNAVCPGFAESRIIDPLREMLSEQSLPVIPAEVVADTVLPAPVAREVRALWRAMRLEMVAGQYLDVRTQAAREVCAERALRVAYLKSAAYTVERPLGLGAALGGAPPAMRDDLESAARSVGLAFQLRDDVLGVFGDPDRTGKPSGDDVRDGKVTYLVAVAEELARQSGDRAALGVLRTSSGDRDLTEEGLERYREVVTVLGALDAVEDKIDALVEESLLSLEKAAPAEPAHRELSRLVLAAAGSGRPLAPAI
ncbi:SDR family oxidoreductase, partial [Streptomyces sparsus]